MSDILTTFPTEAIPGRWRWTRNGHEPRTGRFGLWRSVATVTTADGNEVSRGEVTRGAFLPDDGCPEWLSEAAFYPDIDHFERIPDPAEVPKVDWVAAVERAVGMVWVEAVDGRVWLLSRGAGYQPYAMVDAPSGDGWAWLVWFIDKVGTWPDTEGEAMQVGVALHMASLAILRAIDAGKVTLADGAPGVGALTAAERAALGVG